MVPSDFTDDELHCFLTLSHLVVVADGRFADEEKEELAAICYDVGPERFLTFHILVQEEDRDLDAAMQLAINVTNTETRMLIRTMLHDLAGSDGRHETETVILDRLDVIWG